MDAINVLLEAVDNLDAGANDLHRYFGGLQNDKTGGSHGSSSSQAGGLPIPDDAPTSVKNAKSALLEATTKIQQLLMSSLDFQQQQATNNQHAACIRWLCYFKIPDMVPPEGTSFTKLSESTSLPESHLKRICSMASTAGFFYCPTPNSVAHTIISAEFRSSASLFDTMMLLTETNMPTAQKMVEMTQSYIPDSPSPKRTAFQIAYNTDLGFFPYLSQHPEIGKRLARGMSNLATGTATSVTHLINGFDWASLGTAHVIDVGGSTGHASIALAKAFPKLSFTVQDLPPVIAQAQKQHLDTDIQSRIQFQAHSFLTPQPSSDARIYLIRQCLQNHPQETAVKIIRNLATSLAGQRNARIIFNNVVLPAPGEVGKRDEASMRTRDLFMMQAMDGQERDLSQWKQVIGEAHEGLEIVDIAKPEGSLLSVIEVRLR